MSGKEQVDPTSLRLCLVHVWFERVQVRSYHINNGDQYLFFFFFKQKPMHTNYVHYWSKTLEHLFLFLLKFRQYNVSLYSWMKTNKQLKFYFIFLKKISEIIYKSKCFLNLWFIKASTSGRYNSLWQFPLQWKSNILPNPVLEVPTNVWHLRVAFLLFFWPVNLK